MKGCKYLFCQLFNIIIFHNYSIIMEQFIIIHIKHAEDSAT